MNASVNRYCCSFSTARPRLKYQTSLTYANWPVIRRNSTKFLKIACKLAN